MCKRGSISDQYLIKQHPHPHQYSNQMQGTLSIPARSQTSPLNHPVSNPLSRRMYIAIILSFSLDPNPNPSSLLSVL